MSKRKFKKGAQVVSIAEIPEHDWFIVLLGRNGKTMHREVLRSWSIRTCEQFIDHGFVFVAQRLTNREFYEGMSDEEIREMLEENTKCDAEQAERIAWRNVKDWIAAQVALVETEQATMDELFLPKLVDRNERALYEAFQSGRLMLGDGRSKEGGWE